MLYCVELALQLSVCLWWQDYRRTTFLPSKVVVVMANPLAVWPFGFTPTYFDGLPFGTKMAILQRRHTELTLSFDGVIVAALQARSVTSVRTRELRLGPSVDLFLATFFGACQRQTPRVRTNQKGAGASER